MKFRPFTPFLFFIASLLSLSLCAQEQLGEDIDGTAANDNAGYSLSLSTNGRIVAIGSSGADTNGNEAGLVRIFEWNDVEWLQVGGDIMGKAAFDYSGRGVSLSPDGSRVAIGSYMHDVDANVPDAGLVRVYEWDGTEWVQMGSEIEGKGANDWSGLGESISIKGNRLAIGSPGLGSSNHMSRVSVYEWDELEWKQVGQDIFGEAAGDRSGESISLSSDGNRLAIGAGDNDGNGSFSGHVRVYEWNGNAWIQMGMDIDGEAPGDGSGKSISLSDEGNHLAIGAPYNSGNGNRSGHVRIFEWDDFEWIQIGQDIDGKNPEDWSGRSVSLSADGYTVAVGGCTNTLVGYNPGRVRLYNWDGFEWIQNGGDIVGEGPTDMSGHSVAISANGEIAAIGAFRNSENGNNAGHVRIFDFSKITSTFQKSSYGSTIYPNPTTGIITLKGIENSATATVLDGFGRVCMEANTVDQQLDLTSLLSGIYYVRLNTEGNLTTKKIVKL